MGGLQNRERVLASHPVLVEPGSGNPVELRAAAGRDAGIEDVAPARGARGRDGVERAGSAVLDERHQPVGEVAHVDPLQRIVGRARGEHGATTRGAHRPVAEAIGRIARADDIAGPNDRRAAGERGGRRSLA